MMRSRKQRKHGFSLVEMSIALVVVSIGIVSVAAVFPKQLESVEATTRRTQMVTLAQQTIDTLRVLATAQDIGSLTSVSLPMHDTMGNSAWDSTITVGTGLVNFGHPTETKRFDFRLNYNLEITDVVPGAHWAVSMEIWPGQPGNTSGRELFYTEIFAPGP